MFAWVLPTRHHCYQTFYKLLLQSRKQRAPEQIAEAKKIGRELTQADGATVRVVTSQSGRFNVIVEGERGIITTFRNITQSALDWLAKNYGWKDTQK